MKISKNKSLFLLVISSIIMVSSILKSLDTVDINNEAHNTTSKQEIIIISKNKLLPKIEKQSLAKLKIENNDTLEIIFKKDIYEEYKPTYINTIKNQDFKKKEEEEINIHKNESTQSNNKKDEEKKTSLEKKHLEDEIYYEYSSEDEINYVEDEEEEELSYKLEDIVYGFRYFLATNPFINRFYGDIEFEYSKSVKSANLSTNKNTQVSKLIALGYNDYIYSPKILLYNLYFKFSNIVSKTSVGNNKSETNYKTTQYNLNFKFIKDSFLPFSINTSKSLSPFINFNSQGKAETTNESNNKSLNGSLILRNINLNYSINEVLNENSNSTGLTKNKTNNKSINFRQSFTNSNYFLSYTKLNKMYDIFYDNLNKEKEVVDTFNFGVKVKQHNINYSKTKKTAKNTQNIEGDLNEETNSASLFLDISENIKLSTNINKHESFIDKTLNTIVNSNISWKLNKKSDIYFSASSNEYKDLNLENMNKSLLFSSNYQILNNLSTSYTFSYLPSETFEKNDNLLTTNKYSSNTLSLSYGKKISNNKQLTLGGSISRNQNKSNIEKSNNKSSNYSLVSILKNKLSRFSYLENKLMYSISQSEKSDDLSKLIFANTYKQNITYNFLYNLSLDYERRENFAFENSSFDYKEDIINLSNSLSYSYNIDVRGKVYLNANLLYYNYKRKGLTNQKESYYTPIFKANVNYKILRTLSFYLKSEIKDDTKNSIRNYRFNPGLKYKYRKIKIDFSSEYLKQEDTNGSDTIKNFNISFKRNF